MKPKLTDRIRAAYAVTRQYHAMLALVWPPSQFPNAHRYKTGGGPPACARNFGAALRRMGGRSSGMGSARTVWLPTPTEGSRP